MGKTRIEWTDFTFNPWWGCAKVSEACRSCYAEEWAGRFPKTQGLWGPDAPRKIASEKVWGDPIRWNRAAEKVGERHRVFCASMADVFEDRADLNEPRERLWRLIEQTPALDWLLLTKRPEAISRLSPSRWWSQGVRNWPAHVWVGTTVEDQQRAEERIPHLLRVPARVRFLSCEPLLGPVDLDRIGTYRGEPLSALEEIVGHVERPRVDWVIVGGESGPQARPTHPEWARSLRDQCEDYAVPFFFKQWGSWVPQYEASDDLLGRLDAADPDYSHRGLYLAPDGSSVSGSFSRSLADLQRTGEALMLGVGKKAAGRILDGRTHDEFPEASHASR